MNQAGSASLHSRGAEVDRNQVLESIDGETAEILDLAHWMSAHPELSLEERETSERYVAYLTARDFNVSRGTAEMDTAFVAEYGLPSAPLSIALLAEMDALPEIGHACGHNLSGPASLLAAAALAKWLDPEQLRIVVIGCPAEETGVGKPRLVEAGVFNGIDAAMMAHASDMRRAHRLFLGNRKYEFIYHGKAAHAAAYPDEGINALDGVIALFVGIGLLRQQLPSDIRVHGIISDGGKAPNIIPERAAARVWVRGLNPNALDQAEARVLACARGAAESSGTRLEILSAIGGSPPMKANLPLASAYRRNLDFLGLTETDHSPSQSIGSSDITHISRVVPTIHPNFPIGESLALHTRAFSEAAASERGDAGLLEGARAMALTVVDLVSSRDLREEIAAADQADD
ncbi:MAG: M20 family metallopeptidase [Myxococcales bacterium]|nr:M20 family metallopeptidase [Myxococcales bacterium]